LFYHHCTEKPFYFPFTKNIQTVKTFVTSKKTTTQPHKLSRRNMLRARAGRIYIANPAVEEGGPPVQKS
jgi:hypothetical protein